MPVPRLGALVHSPTLRFTLPVMLENTLTIFIGLVFSRIISTISGQRAGRHRHGQHRHGRDLLPLLHGDDGRGGPRLPPDRRGGGARPPRTRSSRAASSRWRAPRG